MHPREILQSLFTRGFTIETIDGYIPSLKTRLRVKPHDASNAESEEYGTLTIGDFSSIDERIPECIVHLFHEDTFSITPAERFSSDDLQAMLDYWNKEYTAFPKEAFYIPDVQERVSTDQAVTGLTGFKINAQGTHPILRYSAFYLNKTSSGQVYPSIAGDIGYAVSTSWLDQAIPDWRERHIVGISLDLSEEDAANYVFEPFIRLQNTAARSIGDTAPVSVPKDLVQN